MQRLERIHLLSRADKLQPLRQLVRDVSRQQGCSEENLECVVMAVNEACMNVIQHAYHNQDNEEIIIEFYKQDDELIIRMYDFGAKVDKCTIKSRNLDDIRPGGLGVHLIHKVMDKVEYQDREGDGNLLEMHKKLIGSCQCDFTFEKE